MWRRRNKFNAVRSDGRASKLETSVFQMLELMKRAGEITEIKEQVQVQLCECLKTKVDFRVTLPDGSHEYVESKGAQTDRWVIIKAHWRVYGPAPLHIWSGSYKNPKLIESIIPKRTRHAQKNEDDES